MNLSWLPNEAYEGHMTPSTQILNFWSVVKSLTKYKRMLEIGFNAGHSSSINLEMYSDISITSYDVCWHSYTENNASIVKNRFNSRFNFIKGSSLDLRPSDIIGKYDIMFIDGDHSYDSCSSDIRLWMDSDIKYVIIDDFQYEGIKKAHEELLFSGPFSELHTQQYRASNGVPVEVRLFERHDW